MFRVILVGMVSLFVCSCVKDPFFETDSIKTVFKLQPSSFLETVPTRAGVAVQEDKISNVWVLQFNGDADDSKLVAKHYVPDVTDISNLGVKLENGTNQKVLFIANTNDNTLFNDDNAEIDTFTYLDFKSKKFTISSEDDNFVTTSKVLRMYGEYIGNIPNSAHPSVEIKRLCAKVKISYTSIESMDIFNPGIVKIKSVQLKNIPKESLYYIPATSSAPSDVINDRVLSGSNTGSGTNEAYRIEESSGNVTYYTLENKSGTADVATPKKRKEKAPTYATYLEFCGELYVDDVFKQDVKYLVYLGENNTTDYNVSDNKFYQINLTFRGLDVEDTRIVEEEYPWGDCPPVVINDIMWAPVNAGYTTTNPYGLYYQWHRKDGQVYDIATNPLKIYKYNVVPVDYVISFPEYFFSSDETDNNTAADWCNKRQKFWNNDDKFNPCPKGWRIPTVSELESLKSSGSMWTTTLGLGGLNGYWFGPDCNTTRLNSVFFPAAGLLRYSDGDNLSTRGSWGSYWASDLSTTTWTEKAYYLRFCQNIGSDFVITLDNRSSGKSVRCVKSQVESEVKISTNEPSYNTIDKKATLGGVISYYENYNIVENGIVYSTSTETPTIEIDTKLPIGKGIGSFSTNISISTLGNTSYYVRAYAINSEGDVFYGPIQTFKPSYKYPYSNRYAIKIGSLFWAPVNVGYDGLHPYGLLFQWSRKLGQNYTSSYPAGPVPIAQGSNSSYFNDFYTSTSAYSSWCTTNPTTWDMTLYNPCPTGWRLPSRSDFQTIIDLNQTNKKWVSKGPGGLAGFWIGEDANSTKNNSIFFPAAGRKKYLNGAAEDYGTSGYFWATDRTLNSTVGIEKYMPNLFYSKLKASTISDVDNQIRIDLGEAYGATLRCVHD